MRSDSSKKHIAVLVLFAFMLPVLLTAATMRQQGEQQPAGHDIDAHANEDRDQSLKQHTRPDARREDDAVASPE